MATEKSVTPTEEQLEILEYNFCKVNKHPDPTTLCLIAAETGLSEEQTLVSVHPSASPWHWPCSPHMCLCTLHPSCLPCPLFFITHPVIFCPHKLPAVPLMLPHHHLHPLVTHILPSYTLILHTTSSCVLHPQVFFALPTPHCTHGALLNPASSLHPTSSCPCIPTSPSPVTTATWASQITAGCPVGFLVAPMPNPRLGWGASTFSTCYVSLAGSRAMHDVHSFQPSSPDNSF